MLRKASERTVTGLWDLIGRLVDIFPTNAPTTLALAATIQHDRKTL